MEAAWQQMAPVGNALLRSARSILASNQPSTAPCCLAPYYRQNECVSTHAFARSCGSYCICRCFVSV